MRTDLLKYDASSIQELLKRKLVESGLYTDQIYPGSDTRILIDLFSWMFNVLTYLLNNTASNSLFEDVEVYENLNKIVKLLSYNPKTYKTATAEFILTSRIPNTLPSCMIPKYAFIDSGKVDKNGNKIKYSFIENFTFDIRNGEAIYKHNPLLYNGEYIHYIFNDQSQGIPYETFIMSNIGPNGENNELIDDTGIGIYFEKINKEGNQIFTEIQTVNNLILDASSNDLVCEVRLNENKELTFKFGDGLHGKRLPMGGTLHVIYLKSNGADGEIEANELNNLSIQLGVKNIESSEDLVNMCYGGFNSFKMFQSSLFLNDNQILLNNDEIILSNIKNSSSPSNYEDIEEIKSLAPATFRMGNRLVTSNDYRVYILNTFKNIVNDLYICNNIEYAMTFYKWLDKYDKLNINIRLNNYEYSNACDFNNIYLWIKPTYDGNLLDVDKINIIKGCEKIKLLTTNIIPCDSIKTSIIPFVGGQNFDIFEYFSEKVMNEYFIPPVKIFVVKKETLISNSTIKLNIANKIINFFDENSKLGAILNISKLLDDIYSLGYIESIKMVSTIKNKANTFNYINGLSFVCFTTDIIDRRDVECFSQVKIFEKFQYPKLLNKEIILDLIEVVNDSSFALYNKEF